jgi:hypothetical protein
MIFRKRITVIILAVLVLTIGAFAFAAERSSQSVTIQRSAPAFTPTAAVKDKSVPVVSQAAKVPILSSGQMSGEITSSISGKTIHDIFGTAKNIVLDLLNENGVKVGTVTVEDSPDGKSGRYKIAHDNPRHFSVKAPGTLLNKQLQWQYYQQWTTGDDSHNITNIVLKSISPITSAGSTLTFKNVRFEPLSYRAGDKIVIRADLYNYGTQKAYSLVGTHVKNWLYNKDQQIYGNNEEVVDIAPGKSQTMTYVWNSVLCGAPISLIFDPDRVLGETDKSTVWYGTMACAPSHGPDLTVTQIKFKGLSYGGKNPGVSNEVSYSIKNIGDADSIPVKAMAKAGSQKLSIISVPLLKPGGYYSGVFNYTPSNCDPVHINIDTQGVMGNTETNRNNNDIYEDSKVTQWCKNLPQLQFDHVYWKVNGYSFGKSSYPNGSSMDFDVDVGNLSLDETVGCATVVKIRVEVNGQFSTDIMAGNVGFCVHGGGVHNMGTSNEHAAKNVQFKIGPACNADVKFTIDPDHINPELDRTNNTWSTKVQCE